MTWADFLKYSKYIALFYAVAFCMALFGIWTGDPRFVWSGVLFGITSAICNICLAIYHYNHASEMRYQKNVYLVEKSGVPDIAGNQVGIAPMQELQAHIQDEADEAVRKALKRARGW